MNLYFRLMWIIGCSFFKPRVDFDEEIILNLCVLPNDLDINRHLNNGRFLTLLDLASIDLFLRSGLFLQMNRNGFKPMIGGLIVTYRSGMSLLERYTLRIKLAAWDDRWNYFKFDFQKQNGRLSAAGYFKGAFVSKNGLVPNSTVDEIFGYMRGHCVIPPAVENWIKTENAISYQR